MSAKAISILCVLLCAQAFAVRDFTGVAVRSLKQNTATLSLGTNAASSSAEGGASATASGGGSLVGEGSLTIDIRGGAVSTAAAQSELVDRYQAAIVRVKDGEFAIAIAEVEARAYAFAVARATAETSVRIESTGAGGSACGVASANAEANARAFAQVIVDVFASASTPTRFVDAAAAVEAIVEVTVSAFATAESSACGSGVFVADTFINVLAEAFAVPYIEIFALALALVTPGAETAFVVVDVVADVLQVTTVEGDTASVVIGKANAASDADAGANVDVSG